LRTMIVRGLLLARFQIGRRISVARWGKGWKVKGPPMTTDSIVSLEISVISMGVMYVKCMSEL
jgi:hypothetical protein